MDLNYICQCECEKPSMAVSWEHLLCHLMCFTTHLVWDSVRGLFHNTLCYYFVLFIHIFSSSFCTFFIVPHGRKRTAPNVLMEMEHLPVDSVFVIKEGKLCFDCTWMVCMIDNKSLTRLNTPGKQEILFDFLCFRRGIEDKCYPNILCIHFMHFMVQLRISLIL